MKINVIGKFLISIYLKNIIAFSIHIKNKLLCPHKKDANWKKSLCQSKYKLEKRNDKHVVLVSINWSVFYS